MCTDKSQLAESENGDVLIILLMYKNFNNTTFNEIML